MGAYDDVVEFFRRKGPASSNTYYDHAEQQGQTRSAARKRLQRALGAQNELQCLSNISLPHNRRFIYVSQQRGTEAFVERLLSELSEQQSGYATAMEAVRTRGGCLSVSDFEIISGGPVKKRKGHIQASDTLEALIEEGLLETEELDGREYVSFPQARRQVPRKYKRRKVLMEQEDLLLELLTEWLRRNGFVSYDSVTVRDVESAPEWGGYAWDLTAPSYLSAVRGFDKDSGTLMPGFVVADVHARPLNASQVAYFIKKCDAIRANRRNRPFLPILLATRFDKDAIEAGKTKGYLFVVVEQFFGKLLAKQLEVVRALYQDPLKLHSLEPEQIQKLLDGFVQLGVNEAHLRGDIFELIAYCSIVKSYSSCRLGFEPPLDGDDSVDIDVLGTRADELFFVECKGYRSKKVPLGDPSDKKGVQDWARRKIPRMRAWAKEMERLHGRRRKYHFAFWTTTAFEPEALSYLERLRDQTSKFRISWLDGDGLRERFAKEGAPNLIRMLDEHFQSIEKNLGTKAKSAGSVELPQGLGDEIMSQLRISQGPEVGWARDMVKEAIKQGELSEKPTCEECIAFLRGSDGYEPVE